MMPQEYSEATRKIASLDSEINRCCIAHDTPGAMKALNARRALEAAIKTAVATVAVLALLPAIALAATPKQVRKAEAIVAHKIKADPASNPALLGEPSSTRVVCRSTGTTTISCTIGVAGVATFTVAKGKLHETSGPGMVQNTARMAAVTVGQREALVDARSYVQMGGFSLKSLVSQVEFDGFSSANATYGATHAGANWNQQAAEDARSYMQMGGFSASGLIGQLEFDGFTVAQAKFGAKAVGY
jgi:hypothetical protein